MSEYYTKPQIDSQAAVVGARIATRTASDFIVGQIAAAPDANLITDAERDAIAQIGPSKYKGSYSSLGDIPAGQPGDYATLIVAGGDDTSAIWDAGANAWVDTGSSVTGETAASVKSKYESNANTNAFTDAEKAKLAAITDAANIADFTAALDAALA